MSAVPEPNGPLDLPQALQEIERLRAALKKAEHERDRHWETIGRLLPPCPPELDAFLEEQLAHPESWVSSEQFLEELYGKDATP